MFTHDEVVSRILSTVSIAPNSRIRPIDLERALLNEGVASKGAIKQALNWLMQAGRLVYTYRDPCSFVEFPGVESTL